MQIGDQINPEIADWLFLKGFNEFIAFFNPLIKETDPNYQIKENKGEIEAFARHVLARACQEKKKMAFANFKNRDQHIFFAMGAQIAGRSFVELGWPIQAATVNYTTFFSRVPPSRTRKKIKELFAAILADKTMNSINRGNPYFGCEVGIACAANLSQYGIAISEGDLSQYGINKQ